MFAYAKPADLSFFTNFLTEEKVFKGPDYAVSYEVIKEMPDEDKEFFKTISHPIHLSIGTRDGLVCNVESKKLFDAV